MNIPNCSSRLSFPSGNHGFLPQYPVAQNIEYSDTEQYGYIANQNHIDETDILRFDTHVDDRFGNKRQYALQEGNNKHNDE